MSLLTKCNYKKLLPKSKLLVCGYWNFEFMTKTNKNVPIQIQLMCACFYEQKDYFVHRKDAPNDYILSNHQQTIERNKENEDEYRIIFGFNAINIQDELPKLTGNQKLTATWTIQMNNFPIQTTSDWCVSGFFVGLMDKRDLKHLRRSIYTKRFWSIDDAGLACYGRSVVKGDGGIKPKYFYNDINEWERHIFSPDIIKIELILINRLSKSNQGFIRFYKNELLVLEFELRNHGNEEIVYRLYVEMNATESKCSILNFECKMSDLN